MRHVDIVPTILAVLGLDAGRSMQGVDLLAELRGEASERALPQYSEARLAEEGFGMAPLFGVRENGRKWIQAPRPELYDLRADPRETDNLYPRRPEEAAPLEKTLEAIVADSGKRALTAPTREIDRETAEMLRALGYLAPPEERADMAGRDPKDGIAIYAKLQAARQLFQVKQWDRADALLAEVLAEVPENVTARNLLALSAVRRGDFGGAELQYRESLKHQPRQHRVMGALGALALRRNDLDAAQKDFEDALALAPTFVEAMSNLGFVMALRGDSAAAQSWYEKAMAIDPTYPHANRRLADLYYDRKEYARALDYYRRVLVALPRYFDVLIQAGNAARFAGDSSEATRYYAEAATVRPDSWIPPYNLACLQALDGQGDAAVASLEKAVALGFENRGLLDGNEDFESLHGLPGWLRVRDKVPERRRAS
jgi:Tfp pilus assembly protein PilF